MTSTLTAPLSFAQEQLWFLEQMDPGRRTYHVPLIVRLSGALDVPALRTAVTELVRRHETLRTTFEEQDGDAVQVVAVEPEADLPLPVIEGLPGSDDVPGAAQWQRLADAEGAEPFDLYSGPLIRPRLHRVGPEEHLLSLYTHHMISDGWSVGVLVGDLTELYFAAVDGREPDLPELPIQYADYATWERDQLSGPALEEHLGFWERTLGGAQTLDLPTDRPRPPKPSFHGGNHQVDFPGDLLNRLRKLGRAHGATMFMTLLAAFDVVMCRYSGQEDVVVGTALARRDRPELEGLVGFLTNMVILRTDLSGDPTFAEVLARVRDTTLSAYAYQEVPFEKVVERVAPHRDPSRNPLFQVAIGVLPPAPESTSTDRGSALEIDALVPDTGGSRFDMAINATEYEDKLGVYVEYSTDLFDAERIERMLGHLGEVLRAISIDPSLRISEVPILTAAERQQVLHEWQGPKREYRQVPIHQLITEQAETRPDAIAAVCEGSELSYGELDRRSGLLARYLREQGVAAGDVVGVALRRGLDVPVALLAVLRAGGGFLAVDPTHPAARVDYMLNDAGARLLITDGGRGSSDQLPTTDRYIIALDRIWPEAEALADVPLPEVVGPDSMAYVLYTSGSTGRPKGVVIEHRALCTFTLWMSGVFEIGPGDRMLQYAPLVFDLAEGEIFTALTRGATLVLVDEESTLSPPRLIELIRTQRCTYLGAAPAILGQIDAEDYPDLRGVLVGGEAFSGDLVNQWNLPGRTFVNGYGPTEVTIGCAYYVCDHISWKSSPPIGRAMPNRTGYLVDKWDNPVPVGVPGELIVGGDGLARGYLGRPELTAERFTSDPFVPGGRVYRTGDLGVWTADGQIQFLGRVDTQVKLRGQRIELEEIEAMLAAHKHVAQCVVTLHGGGSASGSPKLVGYVVPDGEEPTATQLREHLSKDLPAYMVPAAFMTLDELPLAPTGKVDRTALPDPSALRDQASDGLDRIEPRTANERVVAEVFAATLGLEPASTGSTGSTGSPAGAMSPVGIDDDFFELGGSSLQVASMISRIRDRTGVTLPMRDVYTTPTVSAIATALAEAHAANDRAAGTTASPVIVLRSSGDRPPLFCVPHVFGSSLSYRGLLAHLPDEQPLYLLETPGLDDDSTPLATMAELADTFLDAIRAHCPDGPYVLAGHSMGAVTAYEMALRLIGAGERVGLILVEGTLDQRPGADRNHIAATFLDINTAIADAAPVSMGDVNELDENTFLRRLFQTMRDSDLIGDEMGFDRLSRVYRVFVANARALWSYAPSAAFPGSAALIRATTSSVVPAGAWQELILGGLDEHTVPGNHFSIWSEPQLGTLGATLNDLLVTWHEETQ